MVKEKSTSLHFAAAGGTPQIPHSLWTFCRGVGPSFIPEPLSIHEAKGTLNVQDLSGKDRTVFPPGPVLHGSIKVHQDGVWWPKATTLLYRADAPVPEVSQESTS